MENSKIVIDFTIFLLYNCGEAYILMKCMRMSKRVATKFDGRRDGSLDGRQMTLHTGVVHWQPRHPLFTCIENVIHLALGTLANSTDIYYHSLSLFTLLCSHLLTASSTTGSQGADGPYNLGNYLESISFQKNIAYFLLRRKN